MNINFPETTALFELRKSRNLSKQNSFLFKLILDSKSLVATIFRIANFSCKSNMTHEAEN